MLLQVFLRAELFRRSPVLPQEKRLFPILKFRLISHAAWLKRNRKLNFLREINRSRKRINWHDYSRPLLFSESLSRAAYFAR